MVVMEPELQEVAVGQEVTEPEKVALKLDERVGEILGVGVEDMVEGKEGLVEEVILELAVRVVEGQMLTESDIVPEGEVEEEREVERVGEEVEVEQGDVVLVAVTEWDGVGVKVGETVLVGEGEGQGQGEGEILGVAVALLECVFVDEGLREGENVWEVVEDTVEDEEGVNVEE